MAPYFKSKIINANSRTAHVALDFSLNGHLEISLIVNDSPRLRQVDGWNNAPFFNVIYIVIKVYVR